MTTQTISTSETKIEALTLQSSAYGVTVVVVGGMNRLGGNLVDYVDFQSHATTTKDSSGKGGGVETQNTTYSYSVSVIMALGHGRLSVNRIWKGKAVYTGGWTSAQVLQGVESYTVPATGTMTYTLAHASTAIGSPYVYANATPYDSVLSEGIDYSLANGVLTIRNENWRGASLQFRYSYGSVAFNHNGLNELGLTLTPGDSTQSPPAWMTTTYPARAVHYPGLAHVSGQDMDLGNSATIENHSFEVMGFGAYRYGAALPDCNPWEFASYLLVNGIFGASMPAQALEVEQAVQYCRAAGVLLSPMLTTQMRAGDFLAKMCELTNCVAVPSYDRVRIIPLCDVSVTGNGATYNPNTTPIYDLSDDFWVSNPPVQYSLKQSTDRYNHYRVEYNDRGNYYNKAIAESFDDGDIAINGRRTAPTIASPWICVADVAKVIATLRMQRSLNIVGSGTVKLPWAFCLLDPADLVTLFDPDLLGDEMVPVRITAIGEDENGTLTMQFEDWPLGTASPTMYTYQVPGGYLHDYNAAPGNVAAPAIFEGPAALAGTTGVEVYVATRGVSANWGGAHIWVSLDGAEYRKVGTVPGGSRYGKLNGAVTSGSTSFAVDGLSTVDELFSGSAADASNLATQCYLGGSAPEFFAYQIATLTGAGAYTLTGLNRAAYGSPAAAHADNVDFVRLDERVVRSGPLNPGLIGKTIYVKCTSFNIYGRGQQTLDDVSAFSYVLTGIPASYLPGIGGKSVELNATSLLFQLPAGGGVNPSSILFTAIRKGNLAGTVVWGITGGTLTGSGDTRTLTYANMTTDTATVTATVTDGVGSYIDTITVAKVREGTPGADGDAPVTGYLTNESATVAADSAGVVGSFTGSGGTFKVYFGLTDVSASSTYSVATSSGVTIAINGATGVYTISAMSADTGTATLRANFSGNLIDKVYSITKSKSGTAGNDGLDAKILRLSATAQTITVNGSGALAPSSQTITLVAELQNLTGTAAWTATGYNSAGASTGAVTLGGSGNTRTLTGTQFAVGTNDYVKVVASLSGLSDTMTIIEVADGAQGLPGGDAPLLALLSTSQVFTYNAAGSPNPTSQTITFVAATQNLAGTATFVCTLYNSANASLGTVTLGGSGNTRTLTNTQFLSLGAAAYATIVASLSGYSDTSRIVKLQDGLKGDDAVVSDLTNDSQSLPATSAGVVTSYAGAATTMKVYLGTADDSANWTFARTLGTGTTTANLSGTDGNILTLSLVSDSVESSYVDITATRSGYPTQTKRFTWNKARSAAGTTTFIDGWRCSSLDLELGLANAVATASVQSDGRVLHYFNDNPRYTDWYAPTTSGIGSSYWVRPSFAGTDAGSISGDSGAWYSLSGGKTWSLSSGAGGSKNASVSLLFATDSSGTNIVGSANINLNATSEA